MGTGDLQYTENAPGGAAFQTPFSFFARGAMGSRLPLANIQTGPGTAGDADFTPDPSLDARMLLASPVGLMVEYTSRCNLRCKYCTK
ncbi:MAG: hypothetical protein RL385_299, partial [Pseudomonadota bacterium]